MSFKLVKNINSNEFSSMSAFHVESFKPNLLVFTVSLHIPLEYELINHLSVSTQLTNFALRTSNSTPEVQTHSCNSEFCIETSDSTDNVQTDSHRSERLVEVVQKMD